MVEVKRESQIRGTCHEDSSDSSLGDGFGAGGSASNFMLKSLSELFPDELDGQDDLFGASLSDFMNNSFCRSKLDVSKMTTKWEGNHQSMEKPAEGANSAENWLDSLDNEESSTDFNTSVSKLLGSFSCLMSQNRAITESERQSLTSEVQRLSSIRKAIIESKKASKSKQKSSSRFSMSKLIGQTHLNKPQQCRPYDANGRRQDSNLLPMKLVPTNKKTTRKARVLVGSARLAAPPNKPVRHSSTSELVFPPPPPASITSDSSPVIPRRHQSPRKQVKVVKRLPELRAMGPPPMPVRYASPLKGCDKKDAFSSRDVGAPPSPPPSSDTSPIIPRRYQSPRKQVKYVGRRAEMSQMPSSSSLRRKKIEKQSAFLFEKGI